MKILALDQATKTGWIVGHSAGPVIAGTKELPKTGDDIASYLIEYRLWLRAMISTHEPKMIVFEQPIASRMKLNLGTMRKLYGLANEIEVAAKQHAIPCYEIKTNEAKKTAYGKAGKKPDNAVSLIRSWGINVANADEADAAAVWLDAVRLFDEKAFNQWLTQRAA